MFQPSKRLIVLATGLFVVTLGVAIAQSPSDAPPTQGETKANSIETKIRRALDGAPDGVNSSDPLLDDVLGLIQSRGSILDGSSLDPAMETPLASEQGPSDLDNRARAAECLLRSARLLQRLGPPSASRNELVTKMRHEAGRLLTEAGPPTK
ncbi:hypothetical protein Pla52o_12440 [Novipirellula galeiformis]|uniref:Uncharacterized protein n=1 Tax=Novipirellula galeiformis TaxID=2528004 RepID=A0A5C6CMZ0_9BACT|nr:hypothetical protein [Novipirellula galeiformis]TWU24947.1 hypothetical protein Pla52o_12440 [Novipirellula galeiformis]